MKKKITTGGSDVKCPVDGAPMVLRQTNKFRYKDGRPRKFYGCSRYPQCTEIHGCHPDGTPLGIPATKEIRDMRTAVHALAEKIWKWDDRKQKAQMYAWMKINTKSGHIAKMLEDELSDTTVKLLELMKQRGIQT